MSHAVVYVCVCVCVCVRVHGAEAWCICMGVCVWVRSNTCARTTCMPPHLLFSPLLFPLLELIMFCAIHSPSKEDVVTNILTMSDSEQNQLMHMIEAIQGRVGNGEEEKHDMGWMSEHICVACALMDVRVLL